MRYTAKLSILLLCVASILFIPGCKQPEPLKAKYVFFFIGDGMGVEQVNITQAYLAATNKQIGNEALSFTSMPVVGLSTTYAADKYITCSAAAGTALATGSKTRSGTLGLTADHSDSLYSISYHLNKLGYNVGVSTCVSIDHATPAAFYAHQTTRNNYHEIGHNMILSGFRFFAGGNLIDPDGEKSDSPRGSVYEVGAEAGVYFTHDLTLPDSVKEKYSSIVYAPSSGQTFLTYRIDADDQTVSLSDIVNMGIDVLGDGNPKGFFLMVEGGKIDWACHDNDAATAIGEMMAFSDAIDVAMDFYRKYPNETLIVVTADHETGGISLGNSTRAYDHNLEFLAHQNLSRGELSNTIRDLKADKASFEKVLEVLEAKVGLGAKGLELTSSDKEKLQRAYRVAYGYGSKADAQTIEETNGSGCPLTFTSLVLLNQKAGVGWTSKAHTGSMVPVYSIGVGQELFNGVMDNIDIPRRIATAMGIDL